MVGRNSIDSGLQPDMSSSAAGSQIDEMRTSGQLQDMLSRIKAFEEKSKQRAQLKATNQARHECLSMTHPETYPESRPRRGSVDHSYLPKSQRAIAFDAYLSSRRNMKASGENTITK